MLVQQFIRAHGLQVLTEVLGIAVTEYEDRVTLNYSQIDSPSFHPIVQECRALILRKGSWEVMSRSFDRFFNYGQNFGSFACDAGKSGSWSIVDKVLLQNMPNGSVWTAQVPDELNPSVWKSGDFDFSQAVVWEKLDGSLISLYWDGLKWCVATRKMAFAEGTTALGHMFSQVIETAFGMSLGAFMYGHDLTDVTLICELVSPETRVIKRYAEPAMYLLAVREKHSGKEWSPDKVDDVAKKLGLGRPVRYALNSMDDILASWDVLEATDEGYVCQIVADPDKKQWRLKVKNPSYLAWAHMRNNGVLSIKRIALMVWTQDYDEYLQEFPEDRSAFLPFIEGYAAIMADVKELRSTTVHLFEGHMVPNDQKKAFALLVKDSPVCPILFRMAQGSTLDQIISSMKDPAKVRMLEGYSDLSSL